MASSTSCIMMEISNGINSKDNPLSFSEMSVESHSADITPAKIKRPSKILPAQTVTSKLAAFRYGVKKGTGAAMFYGVIPAIKRALYKLPAAKRGLLVDEINLCRNEARTIYTNMTELIIQFDRVTNDNELDCQDKKIAAMLSVYFLEDSLMKLKPVLEKLKIYTGLLNGNAVRDMHGRIVAGKELPDERHPYRVRKRAEKDAEYSLLCRVANDYSQINNAMLRLAEIGIPANDYDKWKAENRVKIEVGLNTFKAAGSIIGTGIQGAIFSGINFGFATITMSPAIFAVGAYYVVSTVVRMNEIGIKARLQNSYIRHSHERQSGKLTTDVSNIKVIDLVDDIHITIDKLATTSFLIVGNVFHTPITEAFRPIDTRRELPNALYKL